NSATRNVGTSPGTVAAGDDSRIVTTRQAIDDTQIGQALQPLMWISTADDLSNLPSGACRFACNKPPATVLPTNTYVNLTVISKRSAKNGSCILVTESNNPANTWIGTRYDTTTQAGFTWIPLYQTVQNLGLKETLNPTKRVSIGNLGTGAFDGSTPCINIGDSDSGFIGSADGVLDIYCNNAKVGYIDNAGLHMLAGIATNNDVVLQSDARRHIIIQNADGSPRAYIYKDKDGDGVHINNGIDGGGDFIFGKDGSFYAPAFRAGFGRKLAVTSNNNSALSAGFNLWGDGGNRPTVIELGDDQGWHLYSQRNPDGSIVFTVNGDITANTLHAGGAIYANNGDIFGSVWGGWLSVWLNNNKAARNTASLATNGWFKDASTGLIIQWGITGGNLNRAVVNLPIPFPNAGLWSLGWVSGTLDMGNDDWSNSASLLNNSQLTVTTDHWWSTAWIAIGH
ncbi:gp53-like domain-containing protein, partial [Salmonella enterica]|uniref:gp53-like domain-containing protein n=1 Tax=Salmonella enterica TaxID=28901 RepID=UPI003AF32EAA